MTQPAPEPPAELTSAEVAEALPRDLALLAFAYALPATGPGSLVAAFESACFGGDLPLAKLLLAAGPTASGASTITLYGRNGRPFEAVRPPRPLSEWGALRFACRGGHLPVISWLTARGYEPAERHRITYRHALCVACESGHLAAARWLAERAGLSADDLPIEGLRGILAATCGGGHADVARWLVSHFGDALGGGANRPRPPGWHACWAACRGGHLALAQWLASHFGLASATSPRQCAPLLHDACNGGHLKVAQWLAGHFALSRREATSAARHCPPEAREAFGRWLAGLPADGASAPRAVGRPG